MQRHFVETRRCDDGFTYEVWQRLNIYGEPVYFPAALNTDGKGALLGGCLAKTPDDVHKAMTLKR